jgi:hypothetical protein
MGKVHPIIPVLHRKTFQGDLENREDIICNHSYYPCTRSQAIPQHHRRFCTAPRLRGSMREHNDGREVFPGRRYRLYQVSDLGTEKANADGRYLLLVIYVVCRLRLGGADDRN